MATFFDNNPRLKKYLRLLGYFFLGILALVLISSVALKFYFDSNKAEIVGKLNKEINDNIAGTVKIGDVNFKFLTGFPNFTLALTDVEIKDSLWEKHRRTFLKAKEIETRIRLYGILRNDIKIQEIVIKDAKIDVFKDKNGISNSNIFRPKPKEKKSESDSSTKLGEIMLENVTFISENQQRNKLFHFEVASLKSKFKYDENDEDWQTDMKIKVFAKSMAFNTKKGSFIKNKLLKGVLEVSFSKANNKINVVTNGLEIGGDPFDIKAYFNVAKNNSLFGIDIKTKIMWRDVSNLLSNNITSKLNKFNLKRPLKAACTIIGDMNVEGDPEIIVNAEIRDNELSIPDGLIKKCDFKGKFTNNYEKRKGYNDANSAIILTNFSGTYKNVPFKLPSASINNLEKPIATGKLKSNFELPLLKDLVNDQFISFQKGNASVNLNFKVDIVDLRLKKPYYTGNISVKGATFNYVPKNLTVDNTDILLNFTPSKFSMQKIRVQKDKSIINMDFTIDNYLNLYYNDLSKILINWNIYSPYLDVKQLLGYFVSPKKQVTSKPKKKDIVSNKINTILDKCQMVLNIKADKIKYNNLLGSDAKAIIHFKNNTLSIQNGSMTGSSGGTITFEGMLSPMNNNYQFASKVDVNKVNISKFLTGFDNFGIKSFTPQSVRGNLSLKTDMTGKISSKGELIENSLKGNVELNVSDGALVNFEPMKNIKKFVPNRNLDNIQLHELGGKLYANGGKVNLDYFKLSTSVINMDVSGVYAFDGGTNLAVAIPLRNPKDDYKIKNKTERDKLRYTGTVLRLRAVDEGGKTKLKLDSGQK